MASTAAVTTDTGSNRKQVVLTLLLLLFTALGLTFVTLGQPGLPPHFSFDAQKIGYLSSNPQSTLGDRTFYPVAGIYRAFGLTDPIAAGIATYLTFVAIIWYVVNKQNSFNDDVPTIFYAVLSIGLGAVYLGQYSKDILPAFFVAVLVSSWRLRMKILWAFILMLAYAQYFRTYWFLVATVFVVLCFALRRNRPQILVALSAIASWAVMALALPTQGYAGLTDVRATVTDTRSIDAATAINVIQVGPGVLGDVVGTTITWITLFLPYPLLLLANPYHLGIAAVIVLIWAFAFRSMSRITPENTPMIALVLALTIVQAVFEPDYGSYLRHLTPLLPILLVLRLNRIAHCSHIGGATP